MSRAEVEGREMAQQFREKNNLGNQPIGDLVALIEQACAADVAIVEAPADEHGMTMRAAERETVFIAVACTENPMRQRSTLAHELAHVVFGDIGVVDIDLQALEADLAAGEERPSRSSMPAQH